METINAPKKRVILSQSYGKERPVNNLIGIYEKALPDSMTWAQRLAAANKAGFDYVEMSVDESDHRLARLDMSRTERLELVRTVSDSGLRLLSMCLSGHRRFPFGSRDSAVRARAKEIMTKAIDLALDLGIRNIQLAGYDVYYEDTGADTEARFLDGMHWSVSRAAARQVMLSMEIMDTPFMNSISKWKWWDMQMRSPWFTVYPDIGNLAAWRNDVPKELEIGFTKISALHLKETLMVGPDSQGQFRDLLFGTGDVDFVQALKALKKLGYRGSFVLEMWTGNAADPIREIARARDWILARMAETSWPRAK